MIASFGRTMMSICEAYMPVELLLGEDSVAARLMQKAFRDSEIKNLKSSKIQANIDLTKPVQFEASENFWLKQHCRRGFKSP
jgi:hypothetical protein